MKVIFFHPFEEQDSFFLELLSQLDYTVITATDLFRAEQFLKDRSTSILIIEIENEEFDFTSFSEYDSISKSRILFVIRKADPFIIAKGEKISPYVLVAENLDRPLLESFISMTLKSQSLINAIQNNILEHRLVESDKRWRGLLANLQAGVVIHAPDTSILLNNPKASEILGLSLEQMAGKTAFDPHWKFVDHKSVALPLDEYPVNRIIASKMVLHDLVIGVIKDASGEITWALVNGAPVLNDFNDIIEVTITFVDITDQRTAENVVRKSLDEKTILMQEIHHRVKNNIMSIEGLLLLQLRDNTSPEIVKALNDTLGRVKSMRILYEMLTGTDSHQHIMLSSYVRDLVETVISLYPERQEIELKVDLPEVEVSTSQILSIGIIINELVTNSLKYATEDDKKLVLSISGSLSGDLIEMQITDNGPGIPDAIDVGSSTQVGLLLVRMLSKQIGGRLDYSNGVGAVFKLSFPISMEV